MYLFDLKYSYKIRLLERINLLFPKTNDQKTDTKYGDDKLTWRIVVSGYDPLTWSSRSRPDTEWYDSEGIWRVIVQYQNVLTNLQSTSRHYDTTLPSHTINYSR